MAHRDIIVIGASLGGVEALPKLVAKLPAELSAAILVVQHTYPESPSFLADRLNRAGPLTRERIEVEEREMVDKKLEIETRISLQESALDRGVRAIGKPSFYTCPDCHGSMVAIEDGRIRRFRCHTGHAYSERALAECTLPKIEETLWSALAQAEERATLLHELVQAGECDTDTAENYERQAQQMRRLIERMRAVTRDQAFDRSLVEDMSARE